MNAESTIDKPDRNNRNLSEAYWLVKRIVLADWKHKRRGFRLSEISDQDIIIHAFKELAELADSHSKNHPDIDEWADLFAIMVHFAERQGWTEEELTIAIVRKIKQRLQPQD